MLDVRRSRAPYPIACETGRRQAARSTRVSSCGLVVYDAVPRQASRGFPNTKRQHNDTEQRSGHQYQRAIGEPGRGSDKPNPLKNVYFGEQHLHTRASPDAFVIGVRGTWEDAYNWAMGKEIKLSTTGEAIRKSTPYDFVTSRPT